MILSTVKAPCCIKPCIGPALPVLIVVQTRLAVCGRNTQRDARPARKANANQRRDRSGSRPRDQPQAPFRDSWSHDGDSRRPGRTHGSVEMTLGLGDPYGRTTGWTRWRWTPIACCRRASSRPCLAPGSSAWAWASPDRPRLAGRASGRRGPGAPGRARFKPGFACLARASAPPSSWPLPINGSLGRAGGAAVAARPDKLKMAAVAIWAARSSSPRTSPPAGRLLVGQRHRARWSAWSSSAVLLPGARHGRPDARWSLLLLVPPPSTSCPGQPRRRPAHGRPDPRPARGARTGPGGQPRQVHLHGRHQPRAAHADERPAGHGLRPGPLAISTRPSAARCA
jgi:hypothetical protein